MTAKTMLDLGGLAIVDGDPLGLHELEESLAWQANGPLPDWLDGADPDEEDDGLVQIGPSPSVKPALDGLISIDEIVCHLDGPDIPAPVSESIENPSNMGTRIGTERRLLSIDEWNEATLCLLTTAAGQLWAVPFHQVVQVARQSAAAKEVDLFERLEGKQRRQAGYAIIFEDELALIVDSILGPRTLNWAPLPGGSGEPVWVLARTQFAEHSVGLLDWQTLAASLLV